MKKRIIGCSLIFLVIVMLIYVAIAGISIGNFKLPPKLGLYNDELGIRRGLDLDGGASITFAPTIPEDYSGDVDKGIDNVVEVMRKRLTNLGYTEANVFRAGEVNVTVEIPGISSPEEAIDILGQTAKLQFVDSDGIVVLTGENIVSAQSGYDGQDRRFVVYLEISEDSVDDFTEATKRMIKKPYGQNYIAITLDDAVIAQPIVETVITSSTCVITTMSQEEAVEYAAVISAGALPFALEVFEQRTIGPTLGDGALESSLIAAGLGIVLIVILMIMLYRLPGIVASVSLILYVALVGVILAVFQVNLSLPGIAGIILSIGMAVDANVIIFERIKEELYSGKSVAGSVRSGFDRALIAIIDSNITTVIAAIVLLIFGKGTIQGFAVTLLIGVICSMLTAVIVTKYLLRSLVIFGIRHPWLYGLSKKKAAKILEGGADNE